MSKPIQTQKVIISIALRQVFLSEHTFKDWQEYEQAQMEWGIHADQGYWKNPVTKLFDFSKTDQAENFATWIRDHHGVQPTISIDPFMRIIQIVSPGYQC